MKQPFPSLDGTDHAVRIKSRLNRGGVVENVWVENVKATNMKRDVVILTMDYGSDKRMVTNKKPPLFRNFHLKNITADGAPAAIIITGAPESPIQNVAFEDMTITSKKGIVAKEVKDLTFKNLKIVSSEGPVFDLMNASQITIQRVNAPKGTAVFLKLHGQNSKDIHIESSDLSGAKESIVIDQEVAADAVKVE